LRAHTGTVTGCGGRDDRDSRGPGSCPDAADRRAQLSEADGVRDGLGDALVSFGVRMVAVGREEVGFVPAAVGPAERGAEIDIRRGGRARHGIDRFIHVRGHCVHICRSALARSLRSGHHAFVARGSSAQILRYAILAMAAAALVVGLWLVFVPFNRTYRVGGPNQPLPPGVQHSSERAVTVVSVHCHALDYLHNTDDDCTVPDRDRLVTGSAWLGGFVALSLVGGVWTVGRRYRRKRPF